MAKGWYVSSGEQVSGPFDQEAIDGMLAFGPITDEDSISCDGENWVSVADFRVSRQAAWSGDSYKSHEVGDTDGEEDGDVLELLPVEADSPPDIAPGEFAPGAPPSQPAQPRGPRPC